jgi:hypothetical protein
MKLKCLRCNYKWYGGKLIKKTGKVKKPSYCPNCHSPNPFKLQSQMKRKRKKSKRYR